MKKIVLFPNDYAKKKDRAEKRGAVDEKCKTKAIFDFTKEMTDFYDRRSLDLPINALFLR